MHENDKDSVNYIHWWWYIDRRESYRPLLRNGRCEVCLNWHTLYNLWRPINTHRYRWIASCDNLNERESKFNIRFYDEMYSNEFDGEARALILHIFSKSNFLIISKIYFFE